MGRNLKWGGKSKKNKLSLRLPGDFDNYEGYLEHLRRGRANSSSTRSFESWSKKRLEELKDDQDKGTD